ncbi:MAG TPA: efflux RND transporter permease subunit [Kiritimatiellia bacterium]|nr:efflux RND transporter permease subunit [Kiritimatiellia bacterium]HRZ13165.1 efflux RND transporter permease subunit [Kiritimatiellia bacterium]HSA17586.1 efflux RND transporter permease subunit [Kiritimatiellia bacterium]
MPTDDERPAGPVHRVIRFCLEQKLVVGLLVAFIAIWGVIVAPFDWAHTGLVRHPVPVDAIPDIGENQQIVFTDWMGRSPKDVDDQVTYPLTVSLLGMPGVRTVRSYSMFGFSMVYVIFEEGVPFEAAQNRVIARLNGLPEGTLPAGVKPALGPYATALGQVFWYTLEGRDPDGNPAGGWDLDELRSIQDWTVRYHLQAAGGVTEVAGIGGFLREYQVDVDPDALRIHNVSLEEVFRAVRASNLDVGARQIELNRVEYLIRARGFLRGIKDLEDTVVKVNGNVPIYVRNVAKVALGPAFRDGALDKEGAEAVGGVVVVRHGHNPLDAIRNVKARIAEIAPTLPVKAVADYRRATKADLEQWARGEGFEAFRDGALDQEAWLARLNAVPRERWPAGITTSRVTVVPFYDRTGLIYETLGTLNAALYEQILITTIVVIVMAAQLKLSLLVSAVMPLAVAFSFIAMRLFGVDANLVSLSGIAIAIGTIVDMGIITCQNILQHLADARRDESRLEVIYRAAGEVGGAILTAISTTVVGFLPVFAMSGPEGKLFRPLAFTKTFCLVGSVVIALTIVPAAAHLLLGRRPPSNRIQQALGAGLVLAGVAMGVLFGWWRAAPLFALWGGYVAVEERLPERLRRVAPGLANALAVLLVGALLAGHWLPLGPEKGWLRNFVFVAVVIGALQGFYYLVERRYARILRWCLEHKLAFLSLPAAIVIAGYTAWLGFDRLFGFVPAGLEKAWPAARALRQSGPWSWAVHAFPGFGKEFMPPLDEGSFLYMPTTMPHASLGEAMDIVRKQDMALRAIPEVESVVGKIGRAASALDPAPVNMIETVIAYKSEYATDQAGRALLYRYDRQQRQFARDADGRLVPDPRGKPYRQWRDHIRTPDDIWDEIVRAAEVPGSTSAPRLQPIAARLVMLQSGLRAPMGVKVSGPSLEAIERAGLDIERFLKEAPGVEPSAVIADRIVGKPYLEIELRREALARYGMKIEDVQMAIEVAVGGVRLTTTVEGRDRYPVRARYLRERRDSPEALQNILIPAMDGAPIPLAQLADIRYARGPEAVKSEDGFLVSYVLFDRKPGFAEVDVVEACQAYLADRLASGDLALPPGVSYRFAGNYENQLRAQKTLSLILPLTLFVIFLIIYFQFRSVVTTGLVFSTIFVCWGSGLLLIWLYGQPWFLDFSVFGLNLRDLFQVRPVNMSIAIWVGFLALFGIASDDAVVMCAYLKQRFEEVRPATREAIREATVFAGGRRIRACLMTTATTVLALLPVITSRGRGSDLMVPMSLASFGGMLLEVVTMFMAPVLYSWVREKSLNKAARP